MAVNTCVKNRIDSLAKVIRIVTVPPVMILALLITLYSLGKEIFAGKTDMIVAVVGLVILPLAAYPVHRFIPELHDGGREKQRKLAFIFSLAGYVLCFVYAFFYGTVRIKQIFLTYFTTVVILTIFNRLFGIRASGHTASSISPCVFVFSFGYVFAGILFAILFCMSVWASLYLKRHKAVDVAMGVTSFVIAFVLVYVYTGYLI